MDASRTLLWPQGSGSNRGPKPRLSLTAIVGAAIRIADADGLAAVSMQRVAEDLGATKMSLYRHVSDKAELTALMLDQGMGTPPSPPRVHDLSWRLGLQEWSTQLHDRFGLCPWALELAVGARVLGPNELAWLERGLAALTGTPLDSAEKLDVLALLSGHVRGIAQQQRGGAQPEQALATLMAEIVAEHADRYPEVAAAFSQTVGAAERDQALAFGIERILDGVQALLSSRA